VTLANKLTFLRIGAVPFFVLFLFVWGEKGKVIALLIFIFASLSDLLDGWLARKKNEVTSLGKIVDPIADKILVYSAFISFIQLHLVPFWMVIIIMGRDLLIMALRIELASKNFILSANRLAKLKTFFENAAIFFVFFILLWQGFKDKIEGVDRVTYLLMGGATLLALISGIQYWIGSRRHLQ